MTPHAADDRTLDELAEQIDFINPDTFVEGLPLVDFAALRTVAPVFWHKDPGGPGEGFWVITRHADVQEVSRHADVFSSYEHTAILSTGVINDSDEGMTREEATTVQRLLMLNMDPPEHTKLRTIVQRGFSPRVVRDLEVKLREFTTGILDDAEAKGAGNFVEDVAAELPLQAICDLVGIPQEDRKQIFDLSNTLIGFDDPEYQTSPQDAAMAMAQMFGYADGIAKDRVGDDGGKPAHHDDIITKLMGADVDGHAMSSDQFAMFFLLLSVAGNETTRNAISHGMLAFFDHPEQWEIFKRDRPLETAAEEIIRWGTPVMQFQRTALRDYELSGTTIKQGDRLAIYYSSANRDPEVFDQPDTFDVTRDPNPHIAFGGGGPHFCLGAALAKMEIRVMFEMLADRLPNIEQTAPARRLRSMFINGIKDIPVAYKP